MGEPPPTESLTRRDLLTVTGAGAGALGVGGLAGCPGGEATDDVHRVGYGGVPLAIQQGVPVGYFAAVETATAGSVDGPVGHWPLDGTAVARDGSQTGDVAHSGRPLFLGRGDNGWNSYYAMEGRIDDVRVYDRALSASEVGALADGDADDGGITTTTSEPTTTTTTTTTASPTPVPDDEFGEAGYGTHGYGGIVDSQ